MNRELFSLDSPEVTIRKKIESIAANASPKDSADLEELLAIAKAGHEASKIQTLSPCVCALLFMSTNEHNRDLDSKWVAELVRRMTTGLWKFNCASIGFYKDGTLADGQNRLAAAAMAGYSLKVTIVCGMARDAIDTVDNPKVRRASDAAKMDGILNARLKEIIIKVSATYRVAAGNRQAALKSPQEIKQEMERQDAILDTAIRIAEKSMEGQVKPILKLDKISTMAYLFLLWQWPESELLEKLRRLQSGASPDGTEDVLVQAGKVIEDAQDASERKEHLSVAKQLGVAAFALREFSFGRVYKLSIFKKNATAGPIEVQYPASAKQDAAD